MQPSSSLLAAPARARACARPALPLRAAPKRPTITRRVATTTTTTAAPPVPSADAAAAAAAFDALLRDDADKTTPSAPTPDAFDASYYASPQRPGWFKAWWPVAAVENLDTSRPNQLELMGERLVAWQRADGQWTVQADRCPHRLAPMSDGFITKDKTAIVCGYHGYAFCGKKGNCTRVPAAAGGVGSPAEQRAMASRRAALRTLPVREEAGILFVWPDPYSSDPFAEADASYGPPVPEELKGEKYAPLKGRWFERELPHGIDFFHENVLDPQVRRQEVALHFQGLPRPPPPTLGINPRGVRCRREQERRGGSLRAQTTTPATLKTSQNPQTKQKNSTPRSPTAASPGLTPTRPTACRSSS
jgi:nitrite reductase/ring-hydroxylating ferredoxin subunit